MSYCDDCLHVKVCRYVKDVQKFEDKPPVYGSGNEEGPVVGYTVQCPAKSIKTIKSASSFNYPNGVQ